MTLHGSQYVNDPDDDEEIRAEERAGRPKVYHCGDRTCGGRDCADCHPMTAHLENIDDDDPR